MKRLLALLPALIAFQAGAPPALAWTWPAEGPVLRPFVFGVDPYAGGQHRGIDVGGEAGAPVRSPAAGVVSFAGAVPGGGRTVTVETADGYSVTLVHLGTVAVAREAFVPEGARVGTIGPTGTPEHAEPYVHFGVRVTADAHGYLDPLSFLAERPVVPPASPTPPGEPAPAPPPVHAPAPPVPQAPAPAPEAPASPPETPAPAPQAPAQSPQAPAPQTPALTAPAANPSAEASPRDRAAPRATVPLFTADRSGAVDGAVVREPLEMDERAAAPRQVSRIDGEAARVGVPASGREPEAGASRSRRDALLAIALLVAAAAALLGLVTASLLGHQLPQARIAHAAAPVLANGASRSAEDTGALRPAQENRLIPDRDLERVALGEPEPFANLNGDDDAAELVQVSNDACRRPAAAVAPTRFHRPRPRPPSRCRRPETLSAR